MKKICDMQIMGAGSKSEGITISCDFIEKDLSRIRGPLLFFFFYKKMNITVTQDCISVNIHVKYHQLCTFKKCMFS
jgi:hypothetical protein